MATVPVKVNAAIAASNTTLYTAFSGSATTAMLTFLSLTNTTTADITVDLFYENAAASTTRYFGKTITVPATGTAKYHGLITIDTASDKWRAIASAVGVDCLGTVMES